MQNAKPEFPFQPIAEYRACKSAIDAAMLRVCESGNYILGPECAEFEKEFADYCETRYAIAVNSGTSALHLAMRALEIKEGDEVIVFGRQLSVQQVISILIVPITGASLPFTSILPLPLLSLLGYPSA